MKEYNELDRLEQAAVHMIKPDDYTAEEYYKFYINDYGCEHGQKKFLAEVEKLKTLSKRINTLTEFGLI